MNYVYSAFLQRLKSSFTWCKITLCEMFNSPKELSVDFNVRDIFLWRKRYYGLWTLYFDQKQLFEVKTP